MTDGGSTFVMLVIIALVVGAVIWLMTRPTGPQPATILVCGATGVGKSTLINALIGRPVAEAHIGMPVTPNTERIEAADVGFAFYDSRGMEVLEASQTYLLLLSDVLHLRFNPRIRHQIDMVLMCIQEPQGRIDDAHIEIAGLCEDLAIPLGIALTKTEGQEQLLDDARTAFASARFVMPVRSVELKLGAVTIPAENVDALAEALRQHAVWNAAAARARSLTAMKTTQISRAARTLAQTYGENPSAWIAFAGASFSLLGLEAHDWTKVRKALGGMARKAMVDGFFARTFMTKFDNAKIDAANAQHIVPFVIRRFGDHTRALRASDIEEVHRRALYALRNDLPFRSRF